MEAAMISRKDFPASNLREIVAYDQANQTKLTFGSGGAGSVSHLGCVLLNSAMGTNIIHVPYRGTAPAMQDLQAGRIDFICDIITTALPQIEGKAVKPIATLTRERTPVLPDLPTAHEQGMADFDANNWYAFFLPSGTPEPIVNKLNAAAVQAMNSSALRDRLQGLGATVVAPERRTSQYLAEFLGAEIAKWAAPIKSSGVSID
jgi:tripartite-type tricarboxylate transporter receptor subunit TctC